MTTCITCTCLNLRDFPKHANTGFGKCRHDQIGTFVSITIQRECKKFKEAPKETKLKRSEWNDQITTRRNK